MSNSITKYIKLFEDELDGLRAVGVSDPEQEAPVNVDISYQSNYDDVPTKAVMATAGGTFGGDVDGLRAALSDAGVPMPDEDSQVPNDTDMFVTIGNDGHISVQADNEQADELLDILKNAGLYKGNADA